ncbi:MAG: arginyltransferase [Planctomycetaceae bacterium]
MVGHSNSQYDVHELDMTGSVSECSYLPGRMSRMQYRLALSLTPERYEHLLERGWRRFGRTLFRPMCAACSECRSLRIDATAFQPTRSQRRTRNRNDDIQLHVGPPTATSEHLDLYNVYHLDMHERRRWPFREICRDQYFESFMDGEFPFAREFQYRLNDRLVAVGLVDMTDRVMSSIYFYHHPELRERSLGTFSVLRELALAQETGRHWLYMGYYIRDCISMNYKNRFAPHQFLQQYVADDEPAIWQVPE